MIFAGISWRQGQEEKTSMHTLATFENVYWENIAIEDLSIMEELSDFDAATVK